MWTICRDVEDDIVSSSLHDLKKVYTVDSVLAQSTDKKSKMCTVKGIKKLQWGIFDGIHLKKKYPTVQWGCSHSCNAAIYLLSISDVSECFSAFIYAANLYFIHCTASSATLYTKSCDEWHTTISTCCSWLPSGHLTESKNVSRLFKDESRAGRTAAVVSRWCDSVHLHNISCKEGCEAVSEQPEQWPPSNLSGQTNGTPPLRHHWLYSHAQNIENTKYLALI